MFGTKQYVVQGNILLSICIFIVFTVFIAFIVFGSVPVIADGLLVGIVTETDFLRLADQTLAAELPTCP